MKIKKMVADAKIPIRGSAGAAGLDLFAVGDVDVGVGMVVGISTGIAVAIPDGCVGLICDRSGLGSRGITTHVGGEHRAEWMKWLGDNEGIGYEQNWLGGVIDNDYRGEIRVLMVNLGSETWVVKKGDKVAQLLILKIAMPIIELVEESNDLGETIRGVAGFGSTD